MNNELVSIIIPTYNEEKYISDCLNSVIEFDYPPEYIEIFVVDGMSKDSTRNIVSENYCKIYKNIKLIDNPKRTAPFAFNVGINHARGKYIIIIGAHSAYSKDYISKLVKWHHELDAYNIGGVMITDIRNKNKKTIAIEKVLSNKFGVGNATFRTGTTEVKSVDTVAYGCYKKESFEKFGLFNVKLTRNQDIEFNKRIINAGGKIYIVPDVECRYFARETYGGIANNNYENGMWNILTVFYTQDFSSLSLRHFIPLFFVLSIILPALAAIFFYPLIFASLFFLTLYAGLIFTISLKINTKETSFLHLIQTFFVLHFSYGIGSLAGILKLPFIALTKKHD
ncbi:MAG TPA: glycosyltransferase family 2 protein [Bacteroidales bacterium]|nr:glycosyltransferase family 2 protein [Bacteroidales bacterium]